MTEIPSPVRLYRLTHIDNLPTLLQRGALHAPNFYPDDGLPYRTIHDKQIQAHRHERVICCSRGGTVHDYLPFYLGPVSPMLYKLAKGGVDGYTEGQTPLIYLVTWVSDVQQAGLDFAFSDGHGIAAFTRWFDDMELFDQVDWSVVLGRDWADTLEDNDRKRRKQAEFLIYHSLPWAMVRGIAVLNQRTRDMVEQILSRYSESERLPVRVIPEWYYEGME